MHVYSHESTCIVFKPPPRPGLQTGLDSNLQSCLAHLHKPTSTNPGFKAVCENGALAFISDI